MKCKNCDCDYTECDPWQYWKPPHDGWHPMFGVCFLCFIVCMYGGVMEPWGSDETREQQIFVVTPPGIPSPQNCPDPSDDRNWGDDDNFLRPYWTGAEVPEDYAGPFPGEELPF